MTLEFAEATALLKDGMPRHAFAYTPSADPSSWKLPYLTSAGAPDPAHLPGAAAAISEGGFRGQVADIPAAALPVVRAKLRQAYRRWGKTTDELPESIRENDTFAESFLDRFSYDDDYFEQWEGRIDELEQAIQESLAFHRERAFTIIDPQDERDALRAIEQRLREAGGGGDDHPYGAWAGGSKASGGRMAGGGGGAAERDAQDKFLSDKPDKGSTFEALQGGGQKADIYDEDGNKFSGTLLGFQNGDRRQAVLEQNGKKFYVDNKQAGVNAAKAKNKPKPTQLDKDLSSPDPMVRQKAEYKQAVAGKKDTWVAGGGGSEEVFTRQGSRYQRVYNPAKQEHGYLDLGQDTVFTDNALKAAGKTYPNDKSRSVQRTVSKQVKDDRAKFSITKASIAKQNKGLSFKAPKGQKPFDPKNETYKQFIARTK